MIWDPLFPTSQIKYDIIETTSPTLPNQVLVYDHLSVVLLVVVLVRMAFEKDTQQDDMILGH